MPGYLLVDRYRVDLEVGRGGIGIVYRAHDQLLGRPVAVKIISASALDAGSRPGLLAEAQAAAKLNHPNIVTVHDVGLADTADASPFIVMELVEGASLRGFQPASLGETLNIARQICAALEHAHASGVIHRDLKPENILLAPGQTPKLADFGLARLVREATSADSGVIRGTLLYLAPELFAGQSASESSDLYALGVTFYEIVAGRRPFSGDNPAAIITQHLHTPAAPPSALRPDLPPELDALILRLLNKSPRDRPASAQAVRLELEQLADSASIPLPRLAGIDRETAPKFTVLLVDDDPFNREGMRLYLRQAGAKVLEAGDEEQAWSLAQTPGLTAAVVDISIPPDPRTRPRASHNFGMRLARRLKETYPEMGVVLFSAYDDRGSDVFDMVRDGVRGLAYKLKGSAPAALLNAITETIAGRIVIDPEVHANRQGLAEELLRGLTPDERLWVQRAVDHLGALTLRERELAQRLAASHNTEGIARALHLTPKSVENYISHVYDKLGLNEMGRAAPHLRKVVILTKACMIFDLQAARREKPA